MAFWQPMASMVTRARLRSSNSSRAGMAVISLSLARTATGPRDRGCAVAQALTRCSGPSLADPEPRRVWPSMATCLIGKPLLMACTHSRNQAWNAWGLRRLKTRSNVSWDGMPWGNSRRPRSQSRRLRPKVSICCQSWAPAITAHRAMTRMSCNRCNRRWARRGSGSRAKNLGIDRSGCCCCESWGRGAIVLLREATGVPEESYGSALDQINRGRRIWAVCGALALEEVTSPHLAPHTLEHRLGGQELGRGTAERGEDVPEFIGFNFRDFTDIVIRVNGQEPAQPADRFLA